MEQAKKIAVQLIVTAVGVLIALKVKEQLDKARIAAPTVK